MVDLTTSATAYFFDSSGNIISKELIRETKHFYVFADIKKLKTSCYLNYQDIVSIAMYDIAKGLEYSDILNPQELKYILTKLDSPYFTNKLTLFFESNKFITTNKALIAVLHNYKDFPECFI